MSRITERLRRLEHWADDRPLDDADEAGDDILAARILALRERCARPDASADDLVRLHRVDELLDHARARRAAVLR